MRFMPIHDAVELIQMEYAEMPELRLTFFAGAASVELFRRAV